MQIYSFHGNDQASGPLPVLESSDFNNRQRKPFRRNPVFCLFLPGKQKPLPMTRLLLLSILLSALCFQAQGAHSVGSGDLRSDPRLLKVNVVPDAVPDPRLYAAFDSAYIESLRRDNPTLLLRWNFYLDNAFIISDFPPQKGDIAQYPAVQIPDISNMNILVLEKNQRLTRDWQKPVFYRIDGTQQVLMYYPGKEFNRKFREWLAKGE